MGAGRFCARAMLCLAVVLLPDVVFAEGKLFEPLSGAASLVKTKDSGGVRSLRSRGVKVNPQVLQAGATITLNLFDDTDFEIVLSAARAGTKGRQVWRGRVVSKTKDNLKSKASGEATLVWSKNTITGSVRVGGDLYRILPNGAVHEIKELDPSSYPEDHPAHYDSFNGTPLSASATVASAALASNEIKILVAYTQAVAAVVSDPVALIDLAIDETNQSYLNNGLDGAVQVSLVNSVQVDYVETDYLQMLSHLSAASDGYLDELADLRLQNEADAVVLLVDQPDYCGYGYINADYYHAFTVVNYSCATGYYSFAHELGHLAGARHDINTDSGTTPYAFGHGYQSQFEDFRTIMAYNCNNGCPRVNFWSNPALTYTTGESMGVDGVSDNAQVWSLSAAGLANLHEQYVPVSGNTELWFFNIGTQVYSSPVVGMDDVVYFAGRDGYLYAMYADQSLKWQVALPAAVTAELVYRDEVIYYITYQSGGPYELGAVSAVDGSFLWSTTVSANTAAPAIADDGTLYIVVGTSLRAIAPSGNTLWSVSVGGSNYSNPVIGRNGYVYVATSNGELRAFGLDGSAQLVASMPTGYVHGCLSMGADGEVYAALTNGELRAYDEDMNLLWNLFIDTSNSDRCPVIDTNGNLVIGGTGNTLKFISPQGDLLYESSALSSRITSSVAVASNGDLLVATNNSANRLTSAGTLVWSSSTNGNNQSAFVIADNGVAYMGDSNISAGGLRAFDVSGVTLADTPWPMLGGNKGHTSLQHAALNQAPQVSISQPQDGATLYWSAAPFILTAVATDAEDGDLTGTLVWTSDLDGDLVSPSPLSVGVHQITATVVDSEGASSSDTITVTVVDNVSNTAPSISILTPGDGSSRSEDDNPVAFTIAASDQEDGDLGGQVMLSSSLDGVIASPANLSVGIHTIVAEVTDSGGLSASTQIKLEILAHVNVPPVVDFVSPMDGAVISEDDNPISFVIAASDAEDGDLSANAVLTSSLDGVIDSVASLSVGLHQITAEVIDSTGASATATISVQVTAHVNVPPVVTFLSPVDGYEHDNATGTLPLSASAQDQEDGDLTTQVVFQSNIDGVITSPANLSVGTHTLTASVSDSSGASASDAIVVVVFETLVQEDLAYLETFDTLPLDGWSYYQSNATYGRIQVSEGRLLMDVTTNGNYSLNEAVLTLDLSSYANVVLSFHQADHADESTVLPETFTGHYNADGVSVSADGVTWYRALASTDLETDSTGQQYTVDLDALVATIRSNYDATFGYSSEFMIKFQQYDNYAYPTDGRSWDDVAVSGSLITLAVTPAAGIQLQLADTEVGATGCETIQLGNMTLNDLAWIATTASSWISIDGTQQTLEPGESVDVPVCWDSSNLVPGNQYTAEIMISDLTNGREYQRTIELEILPPLLQLPYYQDFSAGIPQEGWTTYSSASVGRIQVVNERLRMDVSSNGNYSLNEATLQLDLAGQSNVQLTFFQSETSDEVHALAAQFTDHANGDGVAISQDGVVWYRVVNATELDVGTAGNNYVVDLDAAVANIQAQYDPSFGYDSEFFIRFQQYDNYSSATDGREWDNINVTLSP